MQVEAIYRKSQIFIVTLVILPLINGCTKDFGVHVDSGSATVNTANGSQVTKTISLGNNYRSVVNTTNASGKEVKRSLETNDQVAFEDGQIVKFPKAAVIRLSQSSGSETTSAELRESDGKLILWVKENGKFRKGDAHDEVWLKEFLSYLKLDDRTPKDVATTLIKTSNFNEPAFREALDKVPESSDRLAMLQSCISQPNLTPEKQVAIVNAAYDKLNFASEQKQVLLALIAGDELSKEARKAIINRLDRLQFESDRSEIQKALLAKE